MVIPLLKKLGLDSMFLKNLRSVSNLAYISKLTERAVFNQTYDHIVQSGLYPLLQSAYRRHHSTETALVKVANDILIYITRSALRRLSKSPLIFFPGWLCLFLATSLAFARIDRHRSSSLKLASLALIRQ